MDNFFQYFYLIYLFLGLLKAVRFTAIFQHNWYRFDKLKDFIWYQKAIFKCTSVVNMLAAMGLLYAAFERLDWLHYAVWFALATELFTFCTRRAVRIPRPTIKVLLLMLVSLAFFALTPLFSAAIGSFALTLVLYPVFILAFYFAVIYPINSFILEIIYFLAHLKIAHMPNLTVVGVTGSYGKSSTKDFIDFLVKDDLKTLKTPKNINSEIGIAKLILTKLKKHHDVLILEMGALSRGEIRKMCKMAPPKISVLTAVDSMHLSLFGSLDKLAQAKSEILLYMRADAKAFVNLDSPASKKSLKHVYSKSPLDMRIETYGTKSKATHLVADIAMKNNKVQFRLGKKLYKSQLYGIQFAHNLTAAILVAKTLGIKVDAIKERIAKLDNNIIQTQLIKHKKGFYILNDSYNSNPTGFLTALENLNQTQSTKHKYLLNSGMYELGAKSSYYHRKVFKQAAKYCDVILLTKPNLQKYLPRNFKKFKIAQTPKEIISYLELNLKKDDILLIEGRTFQLVKQHLLK